MTSAEAAAEAPRVSDRAQTAGIEKSKDAPEFADADRDARTTPPSAHATGVKAREGQVESSDSDSNQDGERNGVKHGDEGRRHGEGAKKVSHFSRTTTRRNARNVPTPPTPEHARPPRCDVVIDAFVDPGDSTRLSWVWTRSERGRRTSTARQPSAFPAARLPSCFSLVGSERFGRARYFLPRDSTGKLTSTRPRLRPSPQRDKGHESDGSGASGSLHPSDMRREGSDDDEDPPCPDEGEVKLSLEPEDLAGAKPSLRLDRDELAVIANTKEWSEEAKACLEEYRKKVESGVNPFEDALPLWRQEQFMAATTSPDPTRKETYEAINAAIMEEAGKERERQTKAKEASDANGTDANANVAVVTKPDADEDEACTLEEKLRGDSPERTRDRTRRRSSPPRATIPFLAAAASAAAAQGKRNSRSLMLGRRWYDSSLYPTPGGAAKPADSNKTETTAANEPAPIADDGSKPPKNNGDGSQFRRPPKLILFPDGSMREVGENGAAQQPAAAAEDDGLTRINSGPRAAPRDSTNSENMQYTLPASHRGRAEPGSHSATARRPDAAAAATPPAADDELVPATARSTVPATRPVRLARGWPAPVFACSELAAGAARVAELSVDGVAARHDELVERHVDERHGGHERPAGAG